MSGDEDSAEQTIADDLVVTKYKMGAEIANREWELRGGHVPGERGAVPGERGAEVRIRAAVTPERSRCGVDTRVVVSRWLLIASFRSRCCQTASETALLC